MTKENQRFLIRGKLINVYSNGNYSIGFIQSDGIVRILAEYIKDNCTFYRAKNFVRYYVSNVEMSEDLLIEKFLVQTLTGEVNASYGPYHIQYSEWTTDEGFDNSLIIGGHDLQQELINHSGEFLHLVIEKKTKKQKIIV